MLDVSEIQTIDHDVMVVGAGGAGLRAAIECSAHKLDTGVVSKSLLGKFLNVWRMAELHARQAPDRVRELEEWGAVFDRTKEGLISQRNFGGHRYPRLAPVVECHRLQLDAA